MLYRKDNDEDSNDIEKISPIIEVYADAILIDALNIPEVLSKE